MNMSILDWLRNARPTDAKDHGDTDTDRRIVGELDRVDPSLARYLAAFAYMLSRVASADLGVSDVESEKMTAIVRRMGQLSDEQSVLVVELAKTQNRLFGGAEDFLVAREFRAIATDVQRHQMLDCLFAVAAADDEVSAEEEGQIRQIASELGFSHTDYVAARMAYSDKRSVFRRERQ